MKVALKSLGLVAVIGSIVLVSVGFRLVDPFEPHIEGKRASEWAELATARATSAEAQFMQTRSWSVLGGLPADQAVSAVLKAYRKQNLGPIERIVRNLGLHRIARVPLLEWSSRLLEPVYETILKKAYRRSEMVSALADGPEPSVALPVLVAHAEVDSTDESWTALNELGPDAGPALVRYVRSHPDQASALTLLCLLQPFRTNCGEPDVVRLREIFLHHPLPPIRAVAATGLGRLGRQAQPAIADLQTTATNQFEWPEVRDSAVEALQALTGTNSRPLLPP
jgi:hypothetical protein